jgi:hypothetical protein
MALPLNNIFLYLQSNDLESNPRNGTWNDLSGNDYDFTTYDTSPNYSVNSSLQSTLEFFNGSRMTSSETFADYIIGTLPWTWEMFITPTSEPTNAWYFSTIDSAETGGFGVKTSGFDGNAISFLIGGSESPAIPYFGGHYVWVRDANSNIRQYVNGVLQSTWTIGTAIINPSVQNSVIGRRTQDVGTYARGNFSIIRGWDVALTGAQVLEAYQDVVATMFPEKITSFDFSDPLCYNGTGTVVNNLGGYFPLDITNVTFIPNGQYSSMHFNGSASYLSALGIPAIGSTFTVNFWGKYTANNATYQATFSAGRLNSTGQGPLIQFNEPAYGQLTGSMNFGAKGTITAGGFSPGIWSFISYTCDGTTAKLYVNGVLQGSDAQDSTSWLSGAFAMGTRVNSTGSAVVTDQTFEGDIAKIDVFNVALGSTAILDQYNAEYSRFFGLIASYNFSDPLCYPGTGNTVFNLEGTLDLPIINATYGGTGQSKFFAFNGSNALIGKNGVTGLGITFSVSLWSKYPAAATSQMYQFSAGTYDPVQGAGPMNGVNTPSTNFVDISFNDGIGLTSFSTSPDVWHNYFFTADGTTLKAYLDGTLAGSASQGIGSWDNGGLYLGVPLTTGGNYYPGYYYNGEIATLDVYNVALGSTAVSTYYNDTSSRFPAPAPPPYVGIVGGRQFAQGFNG